MERKTGQTSWLGEITEEKKSGLVYSAAVVASLLLSFVFVIGISAAGYTSAEEYADENWYLYLSFLLAPVGFAAVSAGYFLRTREPVKSVVGTCRPKYYLIAVLLQVGLLSLSQLNTLFISFLERFGYQPSEVKIPSLEGWGLLGVLLAVAVLPAVFEELVFRGLLLKGMKSFGTVGAALLCGALFSLYHQNPVQTAYQFVCGVAFAFVALQAGSILPTVLSHFLNNALIILLARFGYDDIPAPALLPVLVCSVLCLIGSVVWLLADAGVFRRAGYAVGKTGNGASAGEQRKVAPAAGAAEKANRKEPESAASAMAGKAHPGGGKSAELEAGKNEAPKADKKGFFLCAAAGIAVCAVVWLSGLLSGFGG